jgi:poly(A) polymerase
MIYKGYHIDMNFAQLNSDRVPENIDDNLDELRNNLL